MEALWTGGNVKKLYSCWNPRVGESIVGIILYFTHEDESCNVFVKVGDTYVLLPEEADEAFLISRPPDGALVGLCRTQAGYRW
ncbi:MAG: hypothetical protein C5B54_08205 [Acidobacteria bacterium]|nr:MAG: hypothetical protein C5B54_08205 [Acidobacteriota bacterium]